MRRRGLLILSAALGAAVVLASISSGAVTRSDVTVAITPAKQSVKAPGGVGVTVNSETAYDSYGPPPGNPSSHVTRTVLHFDNDLSFNTAGYPQCDRARIATATTAGADAACGAARIGRGTVTVDGFTGPGSGEVTAFNGVPQNGLPTVLFHSRIGPPLNSTTVLVGTLEPSERGGDFGKQLDIPVEAVGGGYVVIKHFDVKVNKIRTKKASKKKGKPAKYYVAARCKDKDRTWNFVGDSTFQNNAAPGTFQTVSPSTQACTAKKSKKKKKK